MLALRICWTRIYRFEGADAPSHNTRTCTLKKWLLTKLESRLSVQEGKLPSHLAQRNGYLLVLPALPESR